MGSKFTNGRIIGFFFLSVTLIFGSGFMMAFSFYTYGFVLLASGIISVVFIWKLFNRTNRNLALFFEAAKSNDSTLVFPAKTHNHSVDWLYQSMNALNQHIQKIKLEAEVREKYYRTIIRQSATGFVVMSKDSTVELINEAACSLAGIGKVSSNPNLLKVKNNGLFEALCNLRVGEAITFKSHKNYSVQQLLLKANEIKTDSRELILYSIHDINPELSQKEVESYQKLISILTHEIMNSLAPLTSISKTVNGIFNKKMKGEGELYGSDEFAAITRGLKVIEEQSEGILNFVNNYRKLTKIPPPDIREIVVEEWIRQLYVLYNELCFERGIKFEIIQESHDNLKGDKNLLNQVVMNLVNNAIDALEEVPEGKRIQIVFSKVQGFFLVQVGNNGPAIPVELQDKIFVPFFTTKPNGSGIGLSLSGQIVKLHKGSLNVYSDSKEGTIFTIKL